MKKFTFTAIMLMLCTPSLSAAENPSKGLPGAWTLLEIRCPIGCFETTINQFKPEIGRTLNLNAAQKRYSPLGECARGHLRFVLEVLPVEDVLHHMNEMLPPEAVDEKGERLRFTLENTGIGFSPAGEKLSTLKTGILECTDPSWKNKWEQRKSVVSIDKHRMITREEDGALAVYYALPRR